MRSIASGLIVLLISTAACAQSEMPYRWSAGSSVVPQAYETKGVRRQFAGRQTEAAGALPQTTQAEKVRKAEEALQAQLLTLAQALDNLEKRVEEMRKRTESPPRWDVEQVDQDISLVTQELGKITSTDLSPLAELQRNDLRDRLFEIELSLEIAKRRWGGTWSVFGIDFFANAPAVPTVEQRPAPANYKLRVGDKLRVTVLSSLGQESEYHPVVDTSGDIHVPGAGTVRASQKTCEQLRQSLAAKIGSRFKQLRVAVVVESMGTLLVQVAGDVARPGGHTLSGMPTVLSALYQAGGPTKSGTFRRIELSREGEPKRIVDLYDFLLKGDRNQDLPLKDGDLVFVPPVGQTVSIEGDVVRPARYEPEFPITLGEALKMAGGVRATGLQTVQVERVENNEYRVLLNEPVSSGDGQSRFVLKPGDAVTVTSVRPDRTNQVSISGPVRAPGLYGFSDGMRVGDLVKLAQGLSPSDEVYGGRADVLRLNTLAGSEILTFSLDRALAGDSEHNLELRKLDRVFIYQPDQVIFRPKVITIQGAVANPGTYTRTDGMRVSDAVAAAGGLLPEAYLVRADLIRHAGDGSTELVRITLEQAMSGDAVADVKLADRDEITVFEYADAQWSSRVVRIEGAVQRPGVYKRSNSMRISDLLFACGGLLPEAANKAEIGRHIGKGDSSILEVRNLASLAADSHDDLVLEDRDVVTVPADNPSLRASEVVFITGEVAHPGPYALTGRNDRLADVINRAGGPTEYADLRGTLFLRQKEAFENSQQERDVDLILRKSRAFTDKQFLTQLAKMGVPLPAQVIQTAQQTAEYLAKPSEVVAEEKLQKETAPGSETLPQPEAVETPPIGRTQAPGATAAPTPAGKAAPGATLPVIPGAAVPPVGKTGIPSLQPDEAEAATALGPKIGELEEDTMSGFEGRYELALLENSARVSVDLNKAFQDADSADNIPLRQGDQVFIPRITNVVEVIGAVLQPHRFAARGGNSVDYYIARSGGFAQDASKGNVVVVRSNGDALPKGQVRSVEPGDTIVVPTTGLIDIAKKWERIGSVTQVLSDVLSSVFILTRF